MNIRLMNEGWIKSIFLDGEYVGLDFLGGPKIVKSTCRIIEDVLLLPEGESRKGEN